MPTSQQQSLAGKCVLVTRAREPWDSLGAALMSYGAVLYEFPAITIADPGDWRSVDAAILALKRYTWLTFTSRNGVQRFFTRLYRLGQGPALADLRLAAVGTATAQALREHGMEPELVPEQFAAAALAQELIPSLSPGDRVLVVRPEVAAYDLAQAVRAAGGEADDCVVYRTVASGADAAPLRAALAAGRIHYAAVTSGAAVHALLESLGGPAALAPAAVACVGPGTAAAAEAAGLRVSVQAARATAADLAAAIAAHAMAEGEER